MTIQFDAHTEHVSPPAAPETVCVRKVGGRIGAVVEGVRLDGDLDEATVARSAPPCSSTRSCSSGASTTSTTPPRSPLPSSSDR